MATKQPSAFDKVMQAASGALAPAMQNMQMWAQSFGTKPVTRPQIQAPIPMDSVVRPFVAPIPAKQVLPPQTMSSRPVAPKVDVKPLPPPPLQQQIMNKANQAFNNMGMIGFQQSQATPTQTPTTAKMPMKKTLTPQVQAAIKLIRENRPQVKLSDDQIAQAYQKHGDGLLSTIRQELKQKQQQQVLGAQTSQAPQPKAGQVVYKGAAVSPPPPPIQNVIKQVFGPDAGDAAAVAFSENGAFNPQAENAANTDGSADRGIFQVNSNTFNGLMARKPQQMQALGISSFDDMFDPIKNIQVAKLIYDEGGWGRWYGPKRIGLQVYR